MKKSANRVLVMTVALACMGALPARAQSLPAELRPALPVAKLSGQAKMSFLGFGVYQATLWVAPEFSAADYERSVFALELSYLREFTGTDIAKRSLAEMRRQPSFNPEQASLWEQQMRALFPDVRAGDRITGIHQPGTGAVFWSNGRLLGEIRDPVFATLFFGIWLSAQTSEPQLRRALLAQLPAQTPSGAAP